MGENNKSAASICTFYRSFVVAFVLFPTLLAFQCRQGATSRQTIVVQRRSAKVRVIRRLKPHSQEMDIRRMKYVCSTCGRRRCCTGIIPPQKNAINIRTNINKLVFFRAHSTYIFVIVVVIAGVC